MSMGESKSHCQVLTGSAWTGVMHIIPRLQEEGAWAHHSGTCHQALEVCRMHEIMPSYENLHCGRLDSHLSVWAFLPLQNKGGISMCLN